MADVIVAVNAERGIVAVVLYWDTESEPCTAVSPSGIPCRKPTHTGEWHIGFPDNNFGMPRKWKDVRPGSTAWPEQW
jgi:hypothetical protein